MLKKIPGKLKFTGLFKLTRIFTYSGLNYNKSTVLLTSLREYTEANKAFKIVK